MVGRTIGRYRVASRLGQGGYATVWQARDTLLGRNVALKLLDERLASSASARRRFLHEAQAAAALDHPGIIAVHDSGESDGRVYIALSLIEGETLSERAARRLLAFADAIHIVCAAAEALGYAHERGVIHRDVTGRNIMIARDGRVIVLDFGLALAAWESRVTSTQTTMGTAAYMAPEVMRGDQADSRSDLYGLGVVLYEALTGSFPFVSESPQAVFYVTMNLDPVPVRERRPEIPLALERVVMRAIAREPEARFADAGALVAALRGIALEAPGTAVDGPGPPGGGGPAPERRTAEPPDLAARAADRAPLYLGVLPFEAVPSSGDPEGACVVLASRLAEVVGATLARAPAIRVVPPPTGPLPSAPREIAARLGANLLLRGSVRRAGSQVRVDYAVLDPWHGLQVGGGVVDGSALQLFEVEDQVATHVARTLGIEADPPGRRPDRPGDPAARERFLQVLGYLKRYDNEASVDGAIQLLGRLLDSEGEVAVYHAASALAFLHKYERSKQRIWEHRAATACQRALELDPERAEVKVAAGELALRAGQHGAAMRAFEQACQLAPDALEPMLGLARVQAAMGRREDAERICLAAVAAHPDDWRAHILLGRIYFQGREFARALVPWQRVTELTPDNALGRRHLGSALYRLDRFEAAAAAYRESLAIQPSDEAYGNLGAALYFLGRDDEALAALRKATELTPGEPRRWGNLGSACRWLPGHEPEAEMALERAVTLMRERLELQPDQAEAWALLAAWLANRGRFDEARTAIERALELDPKDLQCMVQAGHVYFQLGDREACLRWLRAARGAGYGAGELLRSRELMALRSDPDFMKLVNGDPIGAPGRT